MKYIFFVALGLMAYFMMATQMVAGQLAELQKTYQNFDKVAQEAAALEEK